MLALREHVSRYDDPKQADIHIQELKIHMKHFEEAMKRSGLYRLRNSICTENIRLLESQRSVSRTKKRFLRQAWHSPFFQEAERMIR